MNKSHVVCKKHYALNSGTPSGLTTTSTVALPVADVQTLATNNHSPGQN
ncbi:hypothetical protein [Actinomyces viscosus]|nr:hypothetical protein [Actinomyces viscosus]